MNTTKIWIFRILGLCAAALIIASFLLPWWTADIQEVGIMNGLTMHPYGLEHKMQEYADWLKKDSPPFFLTVIALVFIVVAMIALLISLFLKQPRGSLIMVIVGIMYLGFALVASGYLYWSISKYDIKLTGYSYVDETQGLPWHTGILSRFLPGFYLAYAGGILTVVLAFLRNKITGETGVFWKKSKKEAPAA